MLDEEKEAIEILNRFNPLDCGMEDSQAIDTILNLIEKQSKEIEHQIEKRANQRNELAILNAKQIEFNKLVNTVNSYKGQFIRQEKEIEELKEDSCCMTNCLRRDKEKLFLEDKIKAKIKELEKMNIHEFETMNVLEVLQSLLEKE